MSRSEIARRKIEIYEARKAEVERSIAGTVDGTISYWEAVGGERPRDVTKQRRQELLSELEIHKDVIELWKPHLR